MFGVQAVKPGRSLIMRASVRSNTRQGFTVTELLVVIAIMLTLAAVVGPSLVNTIAMSRLRGAASEFSSLVQSCRIRAVQDSRFYSVYVHAANGNTPQEAFVDIYPQNVNQASGTGGATINAGDPLAQIASEVVEKPVASAPDTAKLSVLLLPTNPNNLVPTDGSAAGSPITFGPEGLPCIPQVIAGAGGGTVCNNRGGGPGTGAPAVAYWVFFQDSKTQAWQAVTVTPAGRVEKWMYDTGTWSKL